MGGIQAGLIVALRVAKSRRVDWPLTVMAVLSAALLAAGVLRHYWDIWVHRTVRGISFIFVAIDAAGDLFSLLSLFFQPTLDVLGLVVYGTELTLWCGVFACGGYYNFRPWIKNKWNEERSMREETASGDEVERRDEGVIEGVALHELPSSTSVFRTPSIEVPGVRERRGPAIANDSGNGALASAN